MGRKKKQINNTQIPQHQIEVLAGGGVYAEEGIIARKKAGVSPV